MLDTSKLKIYGFYHICLINDWFDIVKDQLIKIKKNGLLEKTTTLYVSILGEKEQQKLFIGLINEYKNIEIVIKSQNIQLYEEPILNHLKYLSDSEDFYCYYLHAKGVSITEQNKGWYHGNTDLIHLKSCVNDWREFMEYFLINKFDENIQLLKEFDSCGVNYCKEPQKHYSGNFWWSKSGYIKTLKDLPNLTPQNRWLAEFWIGQNNNGKFYNHKTLNAGYKERLEKTSYR